MKLWQRVALNMLVPSLIAFTLVYLEIKNVKEIYSKINLLEAIEDLDISLLELRRYEKNVLLFKDESENLSRYTEYINKLKTGVAQIESESLKDMGSVNHSSVVNVIGLYEKEFYALRENIIKKQKLIDNIRTPGRDIEMQARDKHLAYEIRRHEKNYLIYKEKDAANDVVRVSEQLSKQSSLKPVLTIYINMFNDIRHYEAGEAETMGKIRKHARAIEKVLFESSQKTHARINAMLYNAETAFIVTSLVVVLCTFFVAAMLSRSVVGTLFKIDRSLDALLKGQPVRPIVEPDAPMELLQFINTFNLTLGKVKAAQGKLDNVEARINASEAQCKQKQNDIERLCEIVDKLEKRINDKLLPVFMLMGTFIEQMPDTLAEKLPMQALFKELIELKQFFANTDSQSTEQTDAKSTESTDSR